MGRRQVGGGGEAERKMSDTVSALEQTTGAGGQPDGQSAEDGRRETGEGL